MFKNANYSDKKWLDFRPYVTCQSSLFNFELDDVLGALIKSR